MKFKYVPSDKVLYKVFTGFNPSKLYNNDNLMN